MTDRNEMRRAELRLRKLYKKIPEFKCIKGCTACCGVVPWSAPEFNALGDKASQHPVIQVLDGTITPMRSEGCMDCPFYVAGEGCSVYEERPFMCRLYGVAEGLPCAMGVKAPKTLSAARAGELMAEYNTIIAQYPAELPKGIMKVKISHKGENGGGTIAIATGTT